MSILKKNKEREALKEALEKFTDYKQQRQQAMQPYMAYTKAAVDQSNQDAIQILMDNPGAWTLYTANIRQDAHDPLGTMNVEMSLKIFDPAVCQQFYSALSGVIQNQPVGMPVWNPSLTITVPRLGNENVEDEDTKSSFRTQDEGKYVTSFREAM